MPPESSADIYYIDAIIAIFLLIAGILLLIIGVDYLANISRTSGLTISYTASGWLIMILGFAGIIYGFKRMIDDIIKGVKLHK